MTTKKRKHAPAFSSRREQAARDRASRVALEVAEELTGVPTEEHAAKTLALVSERIDALFDDDTDFAQVAIVCAAADDCTAITTSTRTEVLAMLDEIGDEAAVAVAGKIRQKANAGEVPILYIGQRDGEMLVQSASAFASSHAMGKD